MVVKGKNLKELKKLTHREAFEMLRKNPNVFLFVAYVITCHKELMVLAIILLIMNTEKIEAIKSWAWGWLK